MTTDLNAWRRVSQTDRVAVRERGRICAHDGCDTILSIYNPARYCSAHVSEAGGRNSRRPRPVRLAACEHCGEEFETRNSHRKYCSDRCRMAAFARRKRAAERAEHRLQRQTADPPGSREGQLVGDAA
jgi:endogenous inhibitor of DNA gyrase (YacG/DUF329 family)